MDGTTAKERMGNTGSTTDSNADLEQSTQSSVDMGEYELTMAEFITPKSQIDVKKSFCKQASTPLNLDVDNENSNTEDETSDSDDGNASPPNQNVTHQKQKVIEEEHEKAPPLKKQKTDQNSNVSSRNTTVTATETSQPSVFVGKFNFRAMGPQERTFFEMAESLNKTIKLSLPKSYDNKLKGYGFMEIISEEASELRESLEVKLSCPNCHERLHPQITFCCANGHAICQKCADQGVDQCPLDNALFIRGQWSLINQIVEIFQFRCKFAEFGCIFRSTPKELSAHEKFCNHRVVKCPLSKDGNVCDEVIPIPFYPEHVEAHHQSHIKTPFTLNTDYECVLPKKDKLDKNNCFFRFLKDIINKVFFLEMTHYNEKYKSYTISVHFIGKESDASNFIYTINVTDSSFVKLYKWSLDCLPNIMTPSEAEKYFLFTLQDRNDQFSVHNDLKYNLRLEKKEDFNKSLNGSCFEETFCDIPVINI